MVGRTDSYAVELIQSLQDVIPEIILNRNVSTMNASELQILLSPVKDILADIDPGRLLNAATVIQQGNAAPLGNGKFIETIQDEIKPYEDGIRYLHMREIKECYSVGIFIFPPGAVIPLHNHPGMSVLSRVLYGNLELQSFDIFDSSSAEDMENELEQEREKENLNERDHSMTNWLLPKFLRKRHLPKPPGNAYNKDTILPSDTIRAYENEANILSAPGVTTLYPKESNIHQFTAGKDGAAVLDVLLPPYDSDQGRDCTFYEKVQDNFGSGNHDARNVCLLREIDQPTWFQCLAGKYKHLGSEIEE